MSEHMISLFLGLLIGAFLNLMLAFIFHRQQKKHWQTTKDSEFSALKNEMLHENDQKNFELQTRLQVLAAHKEELENQHQFRLKELEELKRLFVATREEKIKLDAELVSAQSALSEQKNYLDSLKTQLVDQFKSVSLDTLKQNNDTFLQLAKSNFEKLASENLLNLESKKVEIQSSVTPIFETLNKFETKISDLEKSRIESFASLFTHFQNIKDSQEKLRQETSNLVKALRTPHVRGRWGELQLKRVVEIAGMLEYCDFVQQASVDSDEGKLRPDLIVKLPGGKSLIVDSKAVIQSYIESAQSESEDLKKQFLLEHAKHIRDRIQELSRKAYWEQFESSPEFVVLFLPGENFFSSALEVDPKLIEDGVSQKVIIATPTTLIALLKAVSYGWQQASLTANALEISQLGKELYKRIWDMKEHFQRLGNQLSASVESYNKTLGTLESRVLVTARKFKDLKSVEGQHEIDVIDPIEQVPRQLDPSER